MPTLAAKSSSSGLQGQGRGSRKGIGRSLSFGGVNAPFSCTGSRKADGETSVTMKEEQFNEAAKHVLSLTEKQLAALIKRGDFVEVKGHGQEVSK